MNYKQHVQLAREYGLPPLVVVDQVLPTITRTRDITATDLNWFNGPERVEVDKKLKHGLRSYVRKHGLDYTLWPIAKNVYFYVFREEDGDGFRKAIAEVRQYNENHPRDLGTAAEMMGHILEYSQCCTDALIDNTRSGKNFHNRVRTQLLEGGWVNILGKSISIQGHILPSYYTSGYAPCKPDCSYSIENGRRVLEGMPEQETREAFEGFLINNVLFASADPLLFNYDSFRELRKRMSENMDIAEGYTVRVTDL